MRFHARKQTAERGLALQHKWEFFSTVTESLPVPLSWAPMPTHPVAAIYIIAISFRKHGWALFMPDFPNSRFLELKSLLIISNT